MADKIIVGIIVLAALLYGLRRIRASLKGGGCGGCGCGCSGTKNIPQFKTTDGSGSSPSSCCGDKNTPFSSEAHACKCQGNGL